jgi:hypothetical protein
MTNAINNLTMTDPDRKLLIEILYNERINKSREWTNDAVKTFKDMIDNTDTGNVL